MPVNWLASVNRKWWEEVNNALLTFPHRFPLTLWICIVLLVIQGQNSVLTSQQKIQLYMNNWFISKGTTGRMSHVLFRVSWVRTVILFYRYSCKYLRAVSLLVKFSFFCYFASDLWLMWKTYVVNPGFCSCFQKKSKVFAFWMPIERGHQFGLYLKAEMLNVALFPFCGLVDRRLSALFWQWPAGCLGSCLFRSLQPRIITVTHDQLWCLPIMGQHIFLYCIWIVWVVFSDWQLLIVWFLGWQRMSQRRSGTLIKLILFSQQKISTLCFFLETLMFIFHIQGPHGDKGDMVIN